MEQNERKPELGTELENQLKFVEFMLEGYREETGKRMLTAIKDSLAELVEIKKGGGSATGG